MGVGDTGFPTPSGRFRVLVSLERISKDSKRGNDGVAVIENCIDLRGEFLKIYISQRLPEIDLKRLKSVGEDLGNIFRRA